jgi:hypothetical protein
MHAPGRERPHPALGIVAVLLALVGLVSGCAGKESGNTIIDREGGPGPSVVRPEPSGEPRTVRIGFSTLPPEQTTESYIQAFATAAQYGDLVLIQRNPPWEDFLPGHAVSPATAENTRLERALHDQYSQLDLFYAIDPTDGVVQRTRIANLPAGINPEEGFANRDLREAFIAYTTYVVKNYEPDYLALGVEVNMLYERKPAQFEAFVSLYKEAYRIVKETRPETKVFPTFQLEDLEGTFDEIHPPHWEVLDYFRDSMDVLAISTYPFLGDVTSASEIREDYYSQLRTHFDGEIMIAETAYPSAPVEGESAIGTEEDQAAYLMRLLQDAEANGFSAVVWLAALDPSFARGGAAAVFSDIGLRASDGSNKIAWGRWEEWARRPLAE